MWLNVETQDRFSKVFVVEEYPSLVIFSHGKRKKYVIHEGGFNKNAIGKIWKFPWSYFLLEYTLEKISNGDARFKHYNQELPPLN